MTSEEKQKKGIEKGKERAEKANAAHDAEVAKKGGKLNLKVMRGTKGQGNRKGGK